jgi:cobalt-zinc-cadmium efflux system membrane fusion protein
MPEPLLRLPLQPDQDRIARLTQPVLPAPEAASAKADTPKDSVVITAEGIRISKIGIAPAAARRLDAAISASATVDSTPDAEAVLTARGGTVTRIFKRIGDPVRAGETIALLESRDASAIAADRGAAAARHARRATAAVRNRCSIKA